MRRFRFRLEPLLRLREQVERQARSELATAVGLVNQLTQQVEASKQGVQECADQGALHGPVGQLARSLELSLRRQQWRATKRLQAAEATLATAQASYGKCARELRTVERLAEQRQEAWRLECSKAEQAELDELAALRRNANGAHS